MEKKTIRMADFINKPKLDWVAMKIAAFARLDENNRLRTDSEYAQQYPRVGDHIYRTVEKLISLFRKKFERGQLDGFKLKFTYSYFKQHAESTYCIKTFINHFNTLASAFNSIFKAKERGVLKIPQRDGCNCVCIEFAPGIVQYTNPKFNAIHDLAIQPIVIEKTGFVIPPKPFRPINDTYVPPNPRQIDQRTGDTMRLGDLFRK